MSRWHRLLATSDRGAGEGTRQCRPPARRGERGGAEGTQAVWAPAVEVAEGLWEAASARCGHWVRAAFPESSAFQLEAEKAISSPCVEARRERLWQKPHSRT